MSREYSGADAFKPGGRPQSARNPVARGWPFMPEDRGLGPDRADPHINNKKKMQDTYTFGRIDKVENPAVPHNPYGHPRRKVPDSRTTSQSSNGDVNTFWQNHKKETEAEKHYTRAMIYDKAVEGMRREGQQANEAKHRPMSSRPNVKHPIDYHRRPSSARAGYALCSAEAKRNKVLGQGSSFSFSHEY